MADSTQNTEDTENTNGIDSSIPFELEPLEFALPDMPEGNPQGENTITLEMPPLSELLASEGESLDAAAPAETGSSETSGSLTLPEFNVNPEFQTTPSADAADALAMQAAPDGFTGSILGNFSDAPMESTSGTGLVFNESPSESTLFPLSQNGVHAAETTETSAVLEAAAEPVAGQTFLSEPESKPEPPMLAPSEPPRTVIDPKDPHDALSDARAAFENVTPSAKNIPAALPFSLEIIGVLTDREKTKLVELVEQSALGIRTIDLEPQLEAGRVLLPQISEYAGVLVAQALRGTRARIRLGLAAEIFRSQNSADEAEASSASSAASASHAASRLSVSTRHYRTEELTEKSAAAASRAKPHVIVTSLSFLPAFSSENTEVPVRVIDLVTASLTIKSTDLDPERSREYQGAVERLTLELQNKAHYKGADAILNFTLTLTPTATPTQFKLMAMGSAVKKQN